MRGAKYKILHLRQCEPLFQPDFAMVENFIENNVFNAAGRPHGEGKYETGYDSHS